LVSPDQNTSRNRVDTIPVRTAFSRAGIVLRGLLHLAARKIKGKRLLPHNLIEAADILVVYFLEFLLFTNTSNSFSNLPLNSNIMAKYSKAAGKSVKSAVKRMKKGTLTSGKSDKKVTSKKQAVAIGLSEAREKGAKVPAKKTAAKKAAPKKPARPAGRAAAKKKAAPKKAAAKKKAAPKKSTRQAGRTAAKKAATPKKTAGKKSAPSKSPPKKAASKKSGAKSAAPKAASKIRSKEKPLKSKAKMPGETSDTGEFISTPATNDANAPVTNADVNNIVTPETESDQAVFAATVPNQQYMPEDFKASVQDPYHGNINPSKAKTTQKPSGKKPLWDNRK